MDQTIDLQREAMIKAGVDKTFTDIGVSGAKTDRPELQKALEYCRPGDTFVVWKLDRLGRNLTHVRAVVEDLRERGIGFRSITEGLTDEGPMGKVMIAVLGAFAEFERDVMIERTKAGLEAARKRGSKGGRRRKLDEKKVAELKKLHSQGFPVSRLADMYKVSQPSVYRYLNA